MNIRALLIILLLWPGSNSSQEPSVTTFVIDNDKSWVRVLVYRAGIMSGLGHNHVISTADVQGFIEYSGQVTGTVATLHFTAESLVVDDQELRDLEGKDFSTKVSSKNINKTREHMLGHKLLDADNVADILIQTTEVRGNLDALDATAVVSIAGRERVIRFRATADVSEHQLTVSGTARVSHRDLGLEPFSTALGMLKVHQDMTVRFFLVAQPAPESAHTGQE